jgi:serine/threonine protein kinase
MEYMPNGCLKGDLLAHNDKISATQRLQWILEAAEGLQLLHSANILHCDVEPKNFLLDADLGLRFADFGGSSFEGSLASASAETRFLPPDFNLHRMPTIQDDLYGFGSTIYSIMTGQYPFQELPSNEVEKLYKAHKFPDVTGIPCGEIIERCWRCEFVSAQEIYDLIQAEMLSCKIAVQ